MLALGLLGIVGAIMLAFASVGVLTGERQGVSRSLEAIEAIASAPKGMRRELDRPFSERAVAPVLTTLGSVGRSLTPDARQRTILRRLEEAGSPIGWDVQRVVSLKALGLFAAGGAVLLLWIFGGASLAVTAVVSSAMLALGWFLPDLVLSAKANSRAEQIRRDLPDAIDLLTVCVEAGLAFDGAVKQVAMNTSGPVAEEFARVLAEMVVGKSRSDAIRDMGERAHVPELSTFASAMVQADAYGVPIAEVLRVQSKESRTKRRQRAEELAQRVPVKILFPLIFCILPCIFIVVVGPALLAVADSLVTSIG